MTIDEIRKITEENEDKPDRWYDMFINEYILPAAKKGLHSVKVKTILPGHLNKLKKEGYTLNCYGDANNYCEYWEIEW